MIRRVVLAALCACCIATGVSAADPKISFELEEDSVTVGQPLVLRIKILVPTWLPTPPEFPTLEVPSLMVRLPERASGPVSESINGETWSGVQRAYRLYPLQKGAFQLPRGEVRIVYAEPGQTDPIEYTAPLPDIRFEATVPAGAGALSPQIIADDFALEQQIEGAQALIVGDAITRTLIASIKGTTPVLIPQLVADTDTQTLRGYPKDPVVAETEDRGTLSGTRTETITYVAQTDGTVLLPALSFDWFNIKTQKLETASVPEIELTVSGAPAAPPDPTDIARTIAYAGLAIAIIWGLFRWFRPTITNMIGTLRTTWCNSETHAHRSVVAAISNRDLSAVMIALKLWRSRVPHATDADFAALTTALATVGKARFGAGTTTATSDGWPQVGSAYRQLRKHQRAAHSRSAADNSLPPLNP